MQRNKLDIDGDQVFKLAQMGCTSGEIASVTGCCKRTLERRFAEEMKRGRDELRVSLRKLQFNAAKNGDRTMLVWLGKQFLGQSNEPKAGGPGAVAPPSMVEMAARMDASIPLRPEKMNGNGKPKSNN